MRSLVSAPWRAANAGFLQVRKVSRSPILHNAVALYGTQAATYLFPLAVVPFLARVLGPSYLGLVALSQAVGFYLSMIVDFGFQLSATRRVSRIRDDRDQLAILLAGVMGAKLLLAIAAVVIFLGLKCVAHPFGEHGLILWAGASSGIVQGFSMLWYYQGLERMRTSAAIDVGGRAATALGVFLLVRTAEDAWKVLALQCISSLAVSTTLLVMAHRHIPFRRPTLLGAWSALRESAAMFLFRGAVSLYTTANTLVLGAFAGPTSVSYYSSAEKLTRVLFSLLGPVSQTLFPRLSRLITTDPKKAIRLARLSLGFMVLCSLLLCAAVFASAPLLVRIALGHGYEEVVPVLRILCLLLPTIAANTVLGIQWMLPLGMDKLFNSITILGGILNLTIALCCAPRWHHVGMAWSVVVTELVVTISMYASLKWRELSPLSNEIRLQISIAELLSSPPQRTCSSPQTDNVSRTLTQTS